MEKTILRKEGPDGEEGKVGVVTHHPDHDHVRFDGLVWPDGDAATQADRVWGFLAEALERLDGRAEDIVVTRYFVRDDQLDAVRDETRRARAETVGDPVHAGYSVGVTDLHVEGALFELEVEAEIPKNGDCEIRTRTL